MLRKTHILLFLITCIVLVSLGRAQCQYRIEVNATNFDKNEVILGKYYGTKNFLVDSGRLDSDGQIVFRGERLKEGLYFLSFGKKRVFDFIADGDQTFKVSLDVKAMLFNSTIKGSAQNIRFYDFISSNKYDINKVDSLNEVQTLVPP